MNVLIFTESLKHGGLGHITRCISIYQAFQERNIKPKLLINSEKDLNFLPSDFYYEILNWQKSSKKIFNFLIKSDVAIIDSYSARKDFYKRVSDIVEIPIYIDDTARLKYPPGIVVNGGINSKELPYPRDNKIHYLLGCEYALLRKEYWDAPNKILRAKIKNILITFGGSDSRNLTPIVLDLITASYPEVKKTVVIGQDFGNVEYGEREKDRHTEFIYSPHPNLMKNIMVKADLAISSGGQTLYELARLGIPTIAIGVVENQWNHMNGCEKAGFIKNAGWWNSINLQNRIIHFIEELSDIEQRKSMSTLGRQYIDGLGSQRLVKKIINKICDEKGFYLRNAEEFDCRNIYHLSNDAIVRYHSIHRQRIKWKDHVRWFLNIIRDKNYRFFVIYDADDEFMGQVRFEIHRHQATISISLKDIFRGKGLSTRIIDEACHKLFLGYNSVTQILAYIRPENISSLKTFEESGFKFVKEDQINDQLFHLYRLKKIFMIKRGYLL